MMDRNAVLEVPLTATPARDSARSDNGLKRWLRQCRAWFQARFSGLHYLIQLLQELLPKSLPLCATLTSPQSSDLPKS